MPKRKRSKAILRYDSRIDLLCKECGNLVEGLPNDIKAVTCWRCVLKAVGFPESAKPKTKPEEKRPRGWQFKKKYVSPSGKVYSFGKFIEQTEVTSKRTNPSVSKTERKSGPKKEVTKNARTPSLSKPVKRKSSLKMVGKKSSANKKRDSH